MKHTAKITSKSIEQSGLPVDFKKAIGEYIWNGFDAGASIVELNFDANEVGYKRLWNQIIGYLENNTTWFPPIKTSK